MKDRAARSRAVHSKRSARWQNRKAWHPACPLIPIGIDFGCTESPVHACGAVNAMALRQAGQGVRLPPVRIPCVRPGKAAAAHRLSHRSAGSASWRRCPCARRRHHAMTTRRQRRRDATAAPMTPLPASAQAARIRLTHPDRGRSARPRDNPAATNRSGDRGSRRSR